MIRLSFPLLLTLLAACGTSTGKSDFDPADYGYGTSESDTTGGDTVTETPVTVTVEQGYCAVYEWLTNGDVIERMGEEVISSARSFTGSSGSMMEVDCSNSYVAPQLEPIVSWSADSCVINMVCDGYIADDTCDPNDVWLYAVSNKRAAQYSQECSAGTTTGG